MSADLSIHGSNALGGSYLHSDLAEETQKHMILEEDNLPRQYWVRCRHYFAIATSTMFSKYCQWRRANELLNEAEEQDLPSREDECQYWDWTWQYIPVSPSTIGEFNVER